jgi:DegV family protein with EDD domain
MDIALVTDSTADIPPEWVEKYSIEVMPNFIVIDGQSYEDNVDMTREEFYTRLPHFRSSPTTATASSGSYQELYERLLKQGYQSIISIHPPSKLSGIFNAAHIAAEVFAGKVHVIDSGQISMGLGFHLLAAGEAILSGHTLEKVLECVQEVKRKVQLFAMLDTLEFVRRSGRVSWARASLGGLLSIKPFIELKDGEVINHGRVRTWHKGLDYLLDLYRKMGPVRRLAILHSNAEEEARRFVQMLDLKDTVDPLVVSVTTIIGTHVGPHALGFTAVTE